MWRSRDDDGLQSQRSGVQIQVSAKKNWGGIRSGEKVRVSGVNRVADRDRVRAGGERVTLFQKHPPPPSSPKKSK